MTVVGVPDGHLRRKLIPTFTATIEPDLQLAVHRDLVKFKHERTSSGIDQDTIPQSIVRHFYGVSYRFKKDSGANLDNATANIVAEGGAGIWSFNKEHAGGTTEDFVEWIPISPELVIKGSLDSVSSKARFNLNVVFGAGSTASAKLFWFFWDE